MSERMTLRVTMELLSDTIFGSGFSIPGGEDIAVCQDGQGYPYLKGSTFKGLLRESLENWLAWTGGSQDTVSTLLGDKGWNGMADGRRIQLTALTLENRPADPADCFALRTFTSLENGIVTEDTLRTASCVRTGLVFTGELTCDADDVELLKNALLGIKWAGTMRSRGFGQVKVWSGEPRTVAQSAPLQASCIRYRLHTETPVFVTDLSRSQLGSYETRGYIPGSAVRGMVMSDVARRVPEWFQAHKALLLSEQTRFLDAVPVVGDLVPLPSIRGFYENKEETKFVSVLTGDVPSGLKRAKLGTFCALEGDTVRYWSAETDGVTRIQRHVDEADTEDTKPFQNRYLSAGQDFEGYILVDDPAVMEEITRSLTDIVWLGADRYEGFGKCSLTREAVQQPAWVDAYGCQDRETAEDELYLLALSPLTMLNDCGDPCGIDTKHLAERLGVETVDITVCSTSLAEFGGYNRAWESRIPAVQMYDRGSVFRIKCSAPPAPGALREIELQGLGIRRAEGFGQVLFLSRSRFEGLKHKAAVQRVERDASPAGRNLRLARYNWVMEHSGTVKKTALSRSQLGSIQALCEKAISKNGDWSELDRHLKKNRYERGPKHGSRFKETDNLVRGVLKAPLPETLGVPCEDTPVERLKLLCLLFDYSRKEG